MHDQAMPPADPRAEFIAALRELADYLTEHPPLPDAPMFVKVSFGSGFRPSGPVIWSRRRVPPRPP